MDLTLALILLAVFLVLKFIVKTTSKIITIAVACFAVFFFAESILGINLLNYIF